MRHAGNDQRNVTESARNFGTGSALLSATSIVGDDVCNLKEENLGSIQDIMLDTHNGEIKYAVLSSGGFLGMGDRLFAIPWKALRLDKENKRFTLDIDVERLKKAPGFDEGEWPDMADSTWNSNIESYYNRRSDTPIV
jgi:sporulation protein YlmC with PRC-barrel domain